MRAFMDRDFLLENDTAKHLYADVAEKLPIIDYHCHIQPREIFEDRQYKNLAQLWLGGRETAPDGSTRIAGDHYKWRLMRSYGVPERYITGEAEDYERFKQFAQALPYAIGNPMYHWCHLELKQYFGYEGVLNGDTAAEVWAHCNRMLQTEAGFTARGLIRRSNVQFIGTTDDPVDDLMWHEKLLKDTESPCTVAPSFRPDKALCPEKPGFAGYIHALSKAADMPIQNVDDVITALEKRLLYFISMGCRASDHGLDAIPWANCTQAQANEVFCKAMEGSVPSREETERYQSYLLLALGRMYHKHSIVMQLHYSCQRNVNARMYRAIGPDTGFDAIAVTNCAHTVAQLLSSLDADNCCPRTILYSLNSADFDAIGTLIGCFQGEGLPGKIQMGSAWWFCDTKDGMNDQLRTLARLGLLGSFIGMLTDSRSFLSYTRHAYFRRILCNLIGGWVEAGEYPNDSRTLERLVTGICHDNAYTYFELEKGGK
ncbi:MAG: glucuronate isomerase [Eubacteriales bacterium]|nr:glucuronate isomerase [Eubacteriales bacterium]